MANAAQRHRYQQRSTDANGFADALQNFGIRTEAETQAVLEGSAAAVYESVVYGSPLTNAPGQPVDTGELRDSWQVQKVGPTRYEIFTTVPYARAIEHNWRRIRKAKMKAVQQALGIKRMTKTVRAMIRKGFAGINFRNGGAHSVKLTARHFDRLVTRVVLERFPGTSRNLRGGIGVKGIGINVSRRGSR